MRNERKGNNGETIIDLKGKLTDAEIQLERHRAIEVVRNQVRLIVGDPRVEFLLLLVKPEEKEEGVEEEPDGAFTQSAAWISPKLLPVWIDMLQEQIQYILDANPALGAAYVAYKAQEAVEMLREVTEQIERKENGEAVANDKTVPGFFKI